MLIDPTALEAYREVMEEETDSFITEILDSFYPNARELLISLDKAVNENDVKGFIRAAHIFKSTSATVGAQLVSGLAADLEARATSEPLRDLQPLLSKLGEAYEEAEAKLKEIYP